MNSKVIFLFALVATTFADEDFSGEDLKPELRSADDDSLELGLHTTKYVYSGTPLLVKSADPSAVVTEAEPAVGTNIKAVAPVIGTPQVIQYSAPLVSGSTGYFGNALPISTYVSKPLLQQYSAFPFLQGNNFIVKATDDDDDDDDVKKVVFRGAYPGFSPLVSSFPSASVMTYGVNADASVAQTYTALSGGAAHTVTTKDSTIVPQTFNIVPATYTALSGGPAAHTVTTKGSTIIPQTFNVVPTTYSAFQTGQGVVPSVYTGFSGFNPFFYSAVEATETKDDSVESVVESDD